MLMPNLRHPLPQRNHSRLHTHGLQLRAPKLVRAPRQLGPVDRLVERHLAAMNLQYLRPGLLVRKRELDLPVQTPRAQERRVEDVNAVGGGEDLDAIVGREAVELVEELEHGALHFSVAALFAVEALRADGVELVDEDDGGGFFFGEGEAVAD